jgi:hypothetical protein
MDILVYILWELVLPDAMMEHAKAVVEFQRKTTNQAERRRYGLAYAYTGNNKALFYMDKLYFIVPSLT